MRAFISVNLTKALKREITAVQKQLEQQSKQIRWLSQEGFHLTLKFLGEFSEENIPQLIKTLKPIAEETSPFELELGNLGAFPPRGKLSVVWLGVKEGEKEIIALAEHINKALQQTDFAGESKKIVPHISIGRARRGKPAFVPKTPSAHLSFSRMLVQSFFLMESDLQPTGAVYSQRAEFILKG